MNSTKLYSICNYICRFFAKESSQDALRNILIIAIPAVLLFYSVGLAITIAFAVGTLLSSLTDLPGNRQDKKQTAFWCLSLFLLASSTTLLALHYAAWLIPILLVLFGFFCTLLFALGSRIAVVGTLTLIVISFTLGLKPDHPCFFFLAFMGGSLWFFCISLIHTYRHPYRSLQHAMREGFTTLSKLLKLKAKCYDENIPLHQVYNELGLVHIQVSEQLEMVRSLLLREENLLTTTGITSSHWLSKTYHLIDLYELLMAVDNDYEIIRSQLAHTKALKLIRRAILVLSKEIQACNNKTPYKTKTANQTVLTSCLQGLDDLRDLQPAQMSLLIAPIIDQIRHIRAIIHDIQNGIARPQPTTVSHTYYPNFIPSQPKISTLKSQLQFRSPIFIYALRMACLLGCAGLIGYLLPEYRYASWMILTIILVARPSYSNTQRRNYQRITGSIIGIVLGMMLTFFVQYSSILLFIAMIGLYGFFLFNRPNYMVSVIFVTIAIVLALNVHEGNIWNILSSRLVFTLLGSAFALLGCLAVPVNHRRMVKNLTDALIANFQGYHQKVYEKINGEVVGIHELRLVRKHAQTTLALFYDQADQFRKDPTRLKTDRHCLNHFQTQAYRVHAHLLGLSVNLTKEPLPTKEPHAFHERLEFIQRLIQDLQQSAQQFSLTSK